MADQTEDLRLAILAAGILSAGEIPIGPFASGTDKLTKNAESHDWSVYREQVRAGATTNPGLDTIAEFAKYLHRKLYS